MSVEVERLLTRPPDEARLLSVPCPNSYFAYPQIFSLEPIPSEILSVLEPLWKRSIHLGKPVDIFQLENVFAVQEGLVFDSCARLIDVTRTYHEDEFILSAALKVRDAIASGVSQSLPRGILTKSRGCSNYGHFLFEMLPRAWFARKFLRLQGWPAIVDGTSPVIHAISTQALQQTGFAAEEVIAIGHEVVYFEKLIVVDGLTTHSEYMSPYVMQCLDAIAMNIPPAGYAKIYAPRRPAKTRDFENEADISRLLQQIGFHETRTAELSFVEQIAAFKGADVVVAVSGAALANLVFCKPGTKVFNFTPAGAAEVLFWMIAEARHLHYLEVRCPEVGPPLGNLPWDRMIRVSPENVRRIVTA